VGKFREKLAETARRTPWWGISFLVHALVILILMNWKITIRERGEEVFEAVHVAAILPPPPELPPLDVSTHVAPLPPAIEPPPPEPPDLEEIVDAPALEAVERKGELAVVAVKGGPFVARSPGGRRAVVEGGGGATEESENAVEAGLLWLARKQLSTGGWRAATEGARWAAPGISGLATMSFLGAGYTHKRGKFIRVVSRALAYLKRHQDRQGCIAFTERGQRGGGYMYCHAMAALALVEAYGMTHDPLLQEPAQRAVDFICQTQNSTGGWRYYANSPDGDSSISGWMVMVLRSASLVGLDVPHKAFDGARKFFSSVTNKATGKTNYLRGMPMGVALHAVGLLCNQYLGIPADDPYIERAGALINANPPKWVPRGTPTPIPLDKMALFTGTNNYYYWYYANLALHQRRGPAWDKWHPRVRDLLLRIQERKGDNAGSWEPLTYGGSVGGRVYSTALAILTLEAYYRYAPMYRETVDEVLAAFGEALAAYNHYARLPDPKAPDAEAARTAAIEKLDRFLVLSETKTQGKNPDKTAERRGKAALMLLRLYTAGGEFDQAIALLKGIPKRFPGLLTTEEFVKKLADLHRAHAEQLAEAGQTEKAKQATAAAMNLYYPIVAKSPGTNPELGLWLANGFFERHDWRKALDLYRANVAKVDLRRLDPKSERGKLVAGIYDRIIKCATNLRNYEIAAAYLAALGKLVGPSLDIRRRQAELHRLRGHLAAARRIYDAILQRLPRYSQEWWEIKYEQLFVAFLEGRNDGVARSILTLQLYYPELGGEELKPRFLDLLDRARNARPPATTLPRGIP